MRRRTSEAPTDQWGEATGALTAPASLPTQGTEPLVTTSSERTTRERQQAVEDGPGRSYTLGSAKLARHPSSTPIATRSSSSGDAAGVDTWRLLWKADPPCAEGELSPTRPFELGDELGVGQWMPHLSTLAVEGHPAGPGELCEPAALADAFDRVRTGLSSRGWDLHEFGGFSRLDVTATIDVGDRRAGEALMRSIPRLRMPRCKPDVIGWPPETVYWLDQRSSGRKLARIYDKSLELARRGIVDAGPRFTLLRLEDQRRFDARARFDVEQLTGAKLRTLLASRFAALGQSDAVVEALPIGGQVNAVVAAIESESVSGAVGAGLLGFLHLRSSGRDEALPLRTRQRYRRHLATLGVLDGEGDAEPVSANVRELYERALDHPAWAA